MSILIWPIRFIFLLIVTLPQSKQYFALTSILFIFMVFHAFNGVWFGDFWMHCNVVRELMRHPFSPHHPELLLNAPHLFYSPYSLAVAGMARLFNLNPVTALSMAGLFNFILFALGLKMFISVFLGSGKQAFYTLFFTLFLWGYGAWTYSGFFHFGVIGYVLPYPSTFAMGLNFISFSITILFLNDGKKEKLLLLLFLAVITLLTHPLSAIVLYTGIFSLAAGYQPRPKSALDVVLILSIVPLSFLIALAWPYYPLLKFVFSKEIILDVDNARMYQGVLKKIFPALLGLWPLALRVKRNWKDPLAMMLVFLSLVYIYGWMSQHATYGRVISAIVLVLHMALADWICKDRASTVANKILLSMLWLLVVVGIYFNCSALPCRGYLPGLQNNYSQYLFLSTYTKQDDVILSDLETSELIPAFGGKVVALQSPLPFVAHYAQRQEDVRLFYKKETSLDVRKDILKRNGVNFILINKTENSSGSSSLGSLSSFGKQIYADNDFVLIKTN